MALANQRHIAPDPADERHDGEATLLIVDDDPDILRVVKFYLTKQRYLVETANNAVEALAVLRANPTVELILSDVMMPEMSGLDLLKQVRSNPQWSDLPVILISAEGETSRKIAGLNLGADDFITKPFNFDELMARVRNHLRLRRLQREVMHANELLRQQNERFLEDMEAARMVQLALLPDGLPQGPKHRLASKYVPVDRVGGDFFDAVLLDGGSKLGVLVADVCGHGIAAAFITAMTKISFRNACFTANDPAEVLSAMNRALNPNIKNGYVTAFYGVYDIERCKLAYASGGHPPLLVHRRAENRVFELQPQATFLGFFEKVAFETQVLDTQPGDRIIFYTDGMYESPKPGDDYFNAQRIGQSLMSRQGQDLELVLTGVLDDLRAFVGAELFRDDVTLVGLDIKE
jgi:serine phosphatase RsbU (regulator of sigma subunit)